MESKVIECPIGLDLLISTERIECVQQINANNLKVVMEWLLNVIRNQNEKQEEFVKEIELLKNVKNEIQIKNEEINKLNEKIEISNKKIEENENCINEIKEKSKEEIEKIREENRERNDQLNKRIDDLELKNNDIEKLLNEKTKDLKDEIDENKHQNEINNLRNKEINEEQLNNLNEKLNGLEGEMEKIAKKARENKIEEKIEDKNEDNKLIELKLNEMENRMYEIIKLIDENKEIMEKKREEEILNHENKLKDITNEILNLKEEIQINLKSEVYNKTTSTRELEEINEAITKKREEEKNEEITKKINKIEKEIKNLKIHIKQQKPVIINNNGIEEGNNGSKMLTKKPMTGYKCMACDRSLEDLEKDKGPFVPRNQMPTSNNKILSENSDLSENDSDYYKKHEENVTRKKMMLQVVNEIGPILKKGGWKRHKKLSGLSRKKMTHQDILDRAKKT